MKIKHTLASITDKKPTISNTEMSKIANVNELETIAIFYKELNLDMEYKKSRNGKTWYCKLVPNKKFKMPKVGQPVFHEVELIKNAQLSIFDSIRLWGQEKGITTKGDKKTQYVKLQEESGELAKAILKNDKEEFVDAVGDCVVVLTNLCAIEKLKIEDCIESAYNEIKNRTGKMQNGTFVKNK